MTKKPPQDIGASVRARLQHVARDQGEDFQRVLTRYANERLLFRLASSRHAQAFVLKEAALFTLWTGKPHRATRDVDLLGFGDPGIDSVRGVFTEVLAVPVTDDGVRYDLDSRVRTPRAPPTSAQPGHQTAVPARRTLGGAAGCGHPATADVRRRGRAHAGALLDAR